MKKYTLNVEICITEGSASYDPPKPIKFKFEEIIPEGVNPIQYLRTRLTEEVKKADMYHSNKLEWQEDKSEEI